MVSGIAILYDQRTIYLLEFPKGLINVIPSSTCKMVPPMSVISNAEMVNVASMVVDMRAENLGEERWYVSRIVNN